MSDLASEVVDLILGYGGKKFRLPAGRWTGWSRTIEDLLTVSARRTFKYAARLKGIPAGVGDPRALAVAAMADERCIPMFGSEIPDWYAVVTPGRTEEIREMIDISRRWELEYLDPPPTFVDIGAVDDDDGAVSVIHVEVDARRHE